jgi:ankyrin repeat protein
MIIFRYRRTVVCLLLVGLLGVGYRASHVLLPNLWLPANAEAIKQDSSVRAVDPHIYDDQWFDAARAGRRDISEALLAAGFPINSHTASGYTALVLATYHGSLDEVELLLNAGADPCLPDHSGNTALMGALFKGYSDVAHRLVDLCPVDLTNYAGQTALAFAVMFGRLEFIPELVSRGADLEHLDVKGRSVRQIAIEQGNESATTALVAVGVMR